ncbi:hypothetical protein [Mycobacterium sp. 852014-52144_SCH5372336]|uniref:hypothetical protein n=1 Tax=Mycobacterium sp. 852014-52144_SCH5372336 TaxID=1834115 RepID=UPI0007FDD984|nr:hypothetical protein [Mycobacterium sp. 852014-52144_SCH5372336]OBB73927.1 hypothetical protein A5759_11635 [Mycobacterium sp. 852014-52144_SCH5372336]
MNDTRVHPRGGRLRMPRSRGATSGFLLILLGAWGALAPFIGPLFNFAYSPDQAWTWTTGRGWLEVLPGVVTVVGGLLLLMSRNRATASLGGWLAVAGGVWFIIGRAMAGPLGMGDAGVPVAATEGKRIALELTYFYGLGALIVFLGAAALGRISVRSVRDVEWADRPVAANTAADERAPVTSAPAATTAPTPVTGTTAPAADQPAMAEQRTEVIGPAAEAAKPRRRGLLDRFRSRGHRGGKLAHR